MSPSRSLPNERFFPHLELSWGWLDSSWQDFPWPLYENTPCLWKESRSSLLAADWLTLCHPLADCKFVSPSSLTSQPGSPTPIVTQRLLIRLYLFFTHLTRMMGPNLPMDQRFPIDQWSPDHRDYWESVYSFSPIALRRPWNPDGRMWMRECTCLCLQIKWMSWSVIETTLKKTGGLLVGQTLLVQQDRKPR